VVAHRDRGARELALDRDLARLRKRASSRPGRARGRRGALFDISYVFGSYATGIGFGVTMLAIGAVALCSGALLPRWLALLALAIGLAMVTPPAGYVLGEYTVGPCFPLLAVLAVLLLRGSALGISSRSDMHDALP
jgi:hypothetical protein